MRLTPDERGVPGHVLGGGQSFEMSCGTGEEADLVDHGWDLLVHGQLEGLARVLALGPDQVLGPGLDGVGDAEEGQARSDGVVRRHEEKASAATASGPVDVGRARDRRLGEGSPVLGSISGAVGPSSASR